MNSTIIPKDMPTRAHKEISIIIPNLHSPVIGRTLQSLEGQSYGQDNVEIIVVGMDKHNLVQPDDTVQFVQTPEPLCAAAARNLGIAHAKGEILAFLDADCIAAEDWLEKLMACYEHPSVYTVTGGVDFPADEYWTLCDNISTFYSYHVTSLEGERPYAPTLNFSVRRQVLDAVGLFDESFPGAAGEDIDLTLRIRFAGYALFFRPSVRVYHHPVRNSFSQMMRRSFIFGQNMIKVFWRYRDRRKLSFFHRHPLLLLGFAPFLAAGVTLKIFLGNGKLLKYWYTAPPIFLAKIAWRIGGACQARQALSSGDEIC
jgi:GT2 family glycosyltransferase